MLDIMTRRPGKTLVVEAVIDAVLRSGAPVLVCNGADWYKLRMDDPCDEVDHELVRPAEPVGDTPVWYRGWEASYDFQCEYWTGQGWTAYKGGCDLDAPSVSAGRFTTLLDEIDAEEAE